MSEVDPLIGAETPDGWTVTKRVAQPEDHTGGHFSVPYLVGKGDDRAFLKAMVLDDAIEGESFVDSLHRATSEHKFERQLLEACRAKRLRRIVRIYEAGELRVAGLNLPVPFIVFELASSDLRNSFNVGAGLDAAWRLSVLHQVATGIAQLHSIDIAHQDIKPSNVLLFEKDGAKLGDLGRAVSKEEGGPFAKTEFAGDRTYGPFEVLYDAGSLDWEHGRLVSDAFLLGSLVSFVFSGVGVTSAVLQRLPRELHWKTFGGTFEDVLPHLTAAYAEAMGALKLDLPARIQEPVLSAIDSLCHPNPTHRGFAREKGIRSKTRFLQQVITKLDLLSKRTAQEEL